MIRSILAAAFLFTAPAALAQDACFTHLMDGDAFQGMARVTISPEEGFFWDIEIAARPEGCERPGFEMIIGVDLLRTRFGDLAVCARGATVVLTGVVDDYAVPTEMYIEASRLHCVPKGAPAPNASSL